MPPPLPRYSGRAYSSLISPSRFSLPRFHYRVGLHIVLFEVCSAFTHVAACTLAQSPYFVTAIRGLQTFRHLHACPGCFRLERSPGGPCTHWKSAALSRRTRETNLEQSLVAGDSDGKKCHTCRSRYPPGSAQLDGSPSFASASDPGRSGARVRLSSIISSAADPLRDWPCEMSEGWVERRLAAILAVDVAGYSRLMG